MKWLLGVRHCAKSFNTLFYSILEIYLGSSNYYYHYEFTNEETISFLLIRNSNGSKDSIENRTKQNPVRFLRKGL